MVFIIQLCKFCKNKQIMKKPVTRTSSYQEMKNLGTNLEFCTILSKMRDKCVKRGDFEDIISIKSDNKKVKRVLTKLFKDKLNLKFNLKLWTRSLLQYGDFFIHIHVDKDNGVYDFMILPVEEIYREEGYDGKSDAVRFRWETTGDYFEEWQLVHFRTIESINTLPYGTSVFNSKGELKGDKKSVIEDVKESLEIGLKKIANTHLYFLGYEDEIDNFSIGLN